MLRCLGLAWSLPLLACGGAASGAGAEEPSRWDNPEPASKDLTASDRMWHHFVDVAKARDAVIAGDLAGYRVPLNRLAAGSYGVQTPDAWSEPLAALQAQARAGAEATDLAAAAAGVAGVVGHCGACHEAQGAGPALRGRESGYRPHGRHGITEAMARHVFAAEELWLGLTVPHDAAWRRGADALVQAPVPAPDEGAADAATPAAAAGASLLEAVAGIRAIGERARTATGAAVRQEIYGELLARCAGCHAEHGVRPPPS